MMLASRLWLALLLGGLALLQTSCGGITPLWKGSHQLRNYTIYYSEPVEFQLDFNHTDKEFHARIELVLTYYQGITRTDLPLFLIFEDASHKVTEYSARVSIKENGRWQGVLQDNEIDYTLTYDAVSDAVLQPGKQTLKIYANDEEAEKIVGVVRIEVRIYEIEQPGS